LILVDTSVWIDHFRKNDPRLVRLLELNIVYVHPAVIGEIACGCLKNRDILNLLADLAHAVVASDAEVMHLIAEHKFYGRGAGWVDFHLAASAMLTKCPLWTTDRRLLEIATDLDVAYVPAAAANASA
jgi:predicted nucleic acid-binding protein